MVVRWVAELGLDHTFGHSLGVRWSFTDAADLTALTGFEADGADLSLDIWCYICSRPFPPHVCYPGQYLLSWLAGLGAQSVCQVWQGGLLWQLYSSIICRLELAEFFWPCLRS